MFPLFSSFLFLAALIAVFVIVRWLFQNDRKRDLFERLEGIFATDDSRNPPRGARPYDEVRAQEENTRGKG